MEAFYEKSREDAGEIFTEPDKSRTFPPHYHSDLEVFIVNEGTHTVIYGDSIITLGAGTVAVFDSYDIHGYEDVGLNRHVPGGDTVVIVPLKYLGRLSALRGDGKIANPIIASSTLSARLGAIAREYFSAGADYSESARESAVELFMTLLCEALEFSSKKAGDNAALMRSILAYLDENFRGEASLSDIARRLGFTEAHVSRTFHRYMRKSLSDYVNGMRLDYVERMRRQRDGRKTIELIYEAGFKSQQTYYRWLNKRKDSARR